MARHDTNDRSKAENSNRPNQGGAQQPREGGKQANEGGMRSSGSTSSQSATNKPSNPQAAGGDKNAARNTEGNPTLPRYDDRPAQRGNDGDGPAQRGNEGDGEDIERPMHGRGGETQSLPNYGDDESGDPRRTTVESESGSTSSGQESSRSAKRAAGAESGSQSKGKSDSAGR